MAKVLTLTTDGRKVEIENRITTLLTTQNVTAGSAIGTDYIFLCTGNCTITLPTAVSNANKYTIKNAGTGIITIVFTAGQNADDSTTISLNPGVALDFISNNTNWLIL